MRTQFRPYGANRIGYLTVKETTVPGSGGFACQSEHHRRSGRFEQQSLRQEGPRLKPRVGAGTPRNSPAPRGGRGYLFRKVPTVSDEDVVVDERAQGAAARAHQLRAEVLDGVQ
eukprot:1454046-Pyramimonas_sp.AAC.1